MDFYCLIIYQKKLVFDKLGIGMNEFEIEFWCLMPLSAISWRPALVVEEAGDNKSQCT
jgi:hypothetical protein